MTADADAVFSALADGTRRDILRAVVDDGPCTATQLAAGRTITRQAVTKHLGVLASAGLVRRDRDGREVRYVADTSPLHAAVGWIESTGAAWERRLARLDGLIAERNTTPTPGG